MQSPRRTACEPARRSPTDSTRQTTENLPSRARSASRAKRRTYKSMPPPLAGCRPGEPEKSTHMHRRGDGRSSPATLSGVVSRLRASTMGDILIWQGGGNYASGVRKARNGVGWRADW